MEERRREGGEKKRWEGGREGGREGGNHPPRQERSNIIKSEIGLIVYVYKFGKSQ